MAVQGSHTHLFFSTSLLVEGTQMKQLILLVLGLTLLIGMAHATPLSEWELSDYLGEGFDSQGELKPHYQHNIAVANAQLQELPEVIRQLFLSERIQGEITTSSGKTEYVGIALSQKGIERISLGKIENPTLSVRVDEATVVSILQSDAPVETAANALKNNQIQYAAVTAEGRMETGLVVSTKLFLVELVSHMDAFVKNVYRALAA